MITKVINTTRHWWLYTLLLFLVSIFGIYLLRATTPIGLGIYPDSVTYIMGARNIVNGLGFVRFSSENILKPITHYPPLYSIILSGFGFAGLDIVRAARLLNMILLVMGIWGFAALLYYATHNRSVSLIGAILFLFSPTIFMRYTWALSEPLFFALMLLSFILYFMFINNQKPFWIILLGVVTALLFLTRYIGLIMAVVWVVMIYLATPKSSRLRLILYYCLSLLPLVVFQLLRNYILTGTLTNRILNSLPSPISIIVAGLHTIENWFTPNLVDESLHWTTTALVIGFVVLITGGAMYCGITLFRGVALSNHKKNYLLVILPVTLSLIFYICGILFTVCYYDVFTRLDDRILSPVFLLSLLIVLIISAFLIQKKGYYLFVVAAFLLLIITLSVINLIQMPNESLLKGQGYISETWRISPGISYVKKAENTVIYTDEPAAVYFLTGKVTYQVPFIEIDDNLEDPRFTQPYDDMYKRIIESDGILILFMDDCDYSDTRWLQEMVRDLRLVNRYYDSCIYRK